MPSTGITPKTGRIVVAAFVLLGLIWSSRYFDIFARNPHFASLPRPPQGDLPEYPKIEDLTAAADNHDHSKSSKYWFFGASEDDAVVVEQSEEWFRLSKSQSASTVAIRTSTTSLNAVLSTISTASPGLESTTGSKGASFEEYVAPANVTVQYSATPTTDAGILASVSDLSPSVAATSASGAASGPSPTLTPLILYAYSPAAWALPNLKFFLKHALHGSATFIFIINGALVADGDTETAASTFVNSADSGILDVLDTLEPYAEKYPNTRIWRRTNTCYDLGAYAEVLRSNSTELVKSHNGFILINASLRGPFVPFWSQECWSDAYLRHVGTTGVDSNTTGAGPVKLVGMTINCVNVRPRHIQSMILATDRVGMNILLGLNASEATEISSISNTTHSNIGIDACPTTMDEAVNIEVSLTPLIQSYNYTVRAMMAEYWSQKSYELECTNGDINAAKGAYEGGDLGVFETMFIKTRWAVEADQTERLTGWYDGAVDSGMSQGAWDKCGQAN